MNADAQSRRKRLSTLGIGLLLTLVGTAAYWNSFSGAFVYDDTEAIVENTHIRRLWPPSEAMSLDEWNSGKTVDRRPLLSLTFALNYYFGGLDPWGYHLVNLAIHVLNAMLLYAIIRRTMQGSHLRTLRETPARQAGVGRQESMAFGLAVALLWVVHPLTTGAVTYISQRAESFVAFWYLLTLYCAIRGMHSPRSGIASDSDGTGSCSAPPANDRQRGRWQSLAVLACALGMASKEVMASAPVVVYLYDVIFVSKSYKVAWNRRKRLYLGLAATWIILAVFLTAGTRRIEGDLEQTSALRYLLTQPGVILHYLRLCVWPSPLVLDYNWPLAHSIGGILPQGLVVLALLGGTVWGLVRRRWFGFAGAWFFLILAPSSSVYPCLQRAFQHRMYLPLAAVLVVLALGVDRLLRRALHGRTRTVTAACLVAAALVAFGFKTHSRNEDYRSEIALWWDNIARRPQSAVAHYNLGCALRREGRNRGAAEQFLRAIAIRPDYAPAHNNLGIVLNQAGHFEEAAQHYRRALEIDPDYHIAYNNLGSVLDNLGRHEEAVAQYEKALEYDPLNDSAHNNCGNALMKLGRTEEAIAHYRQAVAANPHNALAYYNWGNALARQGKLEAAADRFRKAIRIDPDQARFHLNLGTVLDMLGDRAGARKHLVRAVKLNPSLADLIKQPEITP